MPVEARPWDELLEGNLAKALEVIRARSAEIVEVPVLVHFTDHTVRHFDQVATNLAALIEDLQESPRKLNRYELFILFAACYLHDVALQETVKLASKRAISELTSDDYVQIRERHGRAAAAWVRASIAKKRGDEDPAPYDLGLTVNKDAEALASFVAPLCEYHSGPLPKTSLRNEEFGSETIRLQFMLHLLRLADGLDMDSRRVNLNRLKMWRIPEDSQVHWWRHHYTDSVKIDELASISIRMRFPKDLSPPFIAFFEQETRTYVDKEIMLGQRVFRANGMLPFLEEVQVTQEHSETKELIPVPLKEFIGKKARIHTERAFADSKPTGLKRDIEFDFALTNWGVVGNPWADIPISSRDEEYVETADLAEKIVQIERLLKGTRGDIRMVFGERGAGKTSFLNNVRERFTGKNKIIYLDLSRILSPISTPEQLYVWVFRELFSAITGESAPEKGVGPEDMRKAVDKFHSNTALILIDNLDRYHEKPDLDLIRRFFGLAQGNLQTVKRKAVILVSATDEWRKSLESKDLNYIGKSSFWQLAKFTPSEVEQLIGNRLAIANSSYERVFAPDAAQLIHKIALGNPRVVVQTCAALYETAIRESRKLIDAKFIHGSYGNDLRNKVAGLVFEMARNSVAVNRTLEGLYTFHILIEKTHSSPDNAWQIVQRILDGEKLPIQTVPEPLRPAMAKIAVQKSSVEGSTELIEWQAGSDAKTFARELKTKGLELATVITVYRVQPILPPGLDRLAVLSKLSAATMDSRVRDAYQRASTLLETLNEREMAPGLAVMKSRFVVEHLMVAFLVKKGIQLPAYYIADHQEGHFVETGGFARQKSPVRLKLEFQDLFKLVRNNFGAMKSFREVKLIEKKSDDHLSGRQRSQLMGKEDWKVVASASKIVFDEFSKAIAS